MENAFGSDTNGFKGLADIKTGQKVGFHDNNGNHGDIFAGDSDEYALDIPNDIESSRRNRTIAVGNDTLGLSREFADCGRYDNEIGNGNRAIIESEHVI